MEENPFLADQDLIAEIRELFEARKFQEVAEKASAALKANPFLNEAEELYNRAVEILNAEPFILEHLKEVERNFSEKNFLQSLASARMILDLDPEHKRAQEIYSLSQQKVESELFVRELINKGEEFFVHGDIERARSEWEKISTIDPGNSQLLPLLTRCDVQHPQKKRPTPEEEDSIARLLADGRTHFKEGRFQEAINIWGRILVIYESHEEAQAALARARRAMEERQREIDEALHRAQELRDKKRLQEAIVILAPMLEKVPDHPDLQTLQEQIVYEIEQEKLHTRVDEALTMGRTAMESREWEQAATKIEEALSLQPGNSEALALDRTVQTEKKKDRAEAHYQDARDHQRGGNVYLAFNEVTHALEANPDHAAARSLLQELESSLGQAEEKIEDEVELEPEDAQPLPSSVPAIPMPAPSPSTTVRAMPPIAAQPVAGTPRRRFLFVSAAIFLGGIGLLVIFFLLQDQIFGSLNEGLDQAATGRDVETTDVLPLAAGADGYMLQGQALLDRKENLDAVYYFQKIPPDSPFFKKACDQIALAQQNLLEIPPQSASTSAVVPETITPQPEKAIPSTSAELQKALAEGKVAFNSANFEMASRSLEHALEIDPNNAEAKRQLSKSYYNMGILALRELDMARAETSIRKVLDLAPDDEIARRQLAVIRRYKDRPSDHNLDVYLKFQQLRE